MPNTSSFMSLGGKCKERPWRVAECIGLYNMHLNGLMKYSTRHLHIFIGPTQPNKLFMLDSVLLRSVKVLLASYRQFP